MKIKLIITLFLLGILYGCTFDRAYGDTKISQEEILKLASLGKLNLVYAKYETQEGNELNQELKELLNQNKLGRDFYGNPDGKIERIRVRPINIKDKFFEIQLGTLLRQDYFNQIELMPIDCNKQKNILENLYDNDQNARNGTGNNMDFENQEILFSLIEQCGFPRKKEVGKKGMDGVFYVLQHSSDGRMAYYFSEMEKATKIGDIEEKTFALMQDRLLMNFGYKQIYGSQIRNGNLYDIEDPLNVNEKRAMVGLPPIEEYIERWNLDFNEELKKMTKK